MGLFARFGVKHELPDVQPRYNVAPTQLVPIIVMNGVRKAVMMRWGLVPFWAKDPKIGNRLINARAESITKRPAFRASVKKRRCIVPVTGFYEWREEGKSKVPYYVHMSDGSFFGIAGLYDRWRKPDGDTLLSFTIITTKANSVLMEKHNRMPAILKPDLEDVWLSEEELSTSTLAELLKPYPSKPIDAYEVSNAVNNARNESPQLIEPVIA